MSDGQPAKERRRIQNRESQRRWRERHRLLKPKSAQEVESTLRRKKPPRNTSKNLFSSNLATSYVERVQATDLRFPPFNGNNTFSGPDNNIDCPSRWYRNMSTSSHTSETNTWHSHEGMVPHGAAWSHKELAGPVAVGPGNLRMPSRIFQGEGWSLVREPQNVQFNVQRQPYSDPSAVQASTIEFVQPESCIDTYNVLPQHFGSSLAWRDSSPMPVLESWLGRTQMRKKTDQNDMGRAV